MGIEMTSVTVKADAQFLQQADDIQNAMSMFMENRSQVIRFSMAFLHSMLFMPESLERQVIVLQRLLCGTSCYQLVLPLEEIRKELQV